MADEKKVTSGFAMDGFNKVQPLTEGYLAKGGINSTSQIKERPPAPAVLPPKATPAPAPVPKALEQKKGD